MIEGYAFFFMAFCAVASLLRDGARVIPPASRRSTSITPVTHTSKDTQEPRYMSGILRRDASKPFVPSAHTFLHGIVPPPIPTATTMTPGLQRALQCFFLLRNAVWRRGETGHMS